MRGRAAALRVRRSATTVDLCEIDKPRPRPRSSSRSAPCLRCRPNRRAHRALSASTAVASTTATRRTRARLTTRATRTTRLPLPPRRVPRGPNASCARSRMSNYSGKLWGIDKSKSRAHCAPAWPRLSSRSVGRPATPGQRRQAVVPPPPAARRPRLVAPYRFNPSAGAAASSGSTAVACTTATRRTRIPRMFLVIRSTRRTLPLRRIPDRPPQAAADVADRFPMIWG